MIGQSRCPTWRVDNENALLAVNLQSMICKFGRLLGESGIGLLSA